MAINVKLATAGIAGVTNLTAGVVTSATLDPVLRDSINALMGSAAYTVTLPPVSSSLIGGTIVEFKNLLTDTGGGVTALVTIDRNGSLIDGLASDITTNTRNEVFRLTYINSTIGWLAV